MRTVILLAAVLGLPLVAFAQPNAAPSAKPSATAAPIPLPAFGTAAPRPPTPPASAAASPAQPAAHPAAHPARRRVHVRPKKVEPPPLPAPEVRLTLDAAGPEAPWTMRVDNVGKVPLQIVADARLLAFDVLPPDARRPVHCALPRDMRPRDDDDRLLVVPPGRAYAEKLDPRLFCFGARDSAALVAGAKVTPRLVASDPSFDVVSPIDGVEPPVAAIHALAGGEATIAPAPAHAPAKEATAADHPLVVTSSRFADAERGADLTLTVTVKNASPHTMRFLLRPETLAFDVTGPSGVGVTDPSPTVHCAWEGEPPEVIPEVLTTLRSKQSASLSVMLAALCPDRTLDHPGLYVVHAKLDTRGVSGRSIGVRTFDGEVSAEGTTRARVHQAIGVPTPSPRPQLVEEKR